MVYSRYMALFGRSKKDEAQHVPSILGIDIGTSSVKLVEMVAEQGKPRLLTYAYAEVEDGAQTVSGVLPADKMGEVIKELVAQAGAQGTKVVASLPSAQVFHAVVSVPTPKQPEELRALVEAQVTKLLPTPLSEVALDAVAIGELAREGQTSFTRVLTTAVPKTMIAQYENIFSTTGLQLISLETEVAALSRALIGPEQGVVMVVDMGGERTTVSVCEDSVPILVRGIKSGGLAVTQAFSRALNVPSLDAENMKRDLAVAANGALPPALLEAVKSIVHELRYTKQLYTDQRSLPVQKILLSGGGSLLPGLAAYLSNELNVNTYVADPWARVAAPQEARGLLEAVGARLAVAVGLAMRVVE